MIRMLICMLLEPVGCQNKDFLFIFIYFFLQINVKNVFYIYYLIKMSTYFQKINTYVFFLKINFYIWKIRQAHTLVIVEGNKVLQILVSDKSISWIQDPTLGWFWICNRKGQSLTALLQGVVHFLTHIYLLVLITC